MTGLVFVDCETTGLDETSGHEPWEVALIVREVVDDNAGGTYLFRAKIALPYKSAELGLHFGVETKPEDKHTAMGDARWARDLYDAIFDEG